MNKTSTLLGICVLLGTAACGGGDLLADPGTGLQITSVSEPAAGNSDEAPTPTTANAASSGSSEPGSESGNDTAVDPADLTIQAETSGTAGTTSTGGGTGGIISETTSHGTTIGETTIHESDTNREPAPACMPAATPPVGDCGALGIVLDPAFAADYSCVDLGTLAPIPNPWGGFAMKAQDTDTLLITGGARSPGGRLYAVPIGRDAECHISGFTGVSVDIAEAPFNEAGVAYGPEGVLFLAQAIVNNMGQLKSGSHVTDKIVDMGALGFGKTMCGVGFVPPGFPGAGRLKLINWPSPGSWYDASHAPDGAGTYDITSVTPMASLPGGAAGFVFIAAGNVGFPKNTVLVSEYGAGKVVAYELVGMSDPDPTTRRPFINGLTGAQGGVVDPVSGDFLFSTFAPARIIAIRGFKPLPG